MSPNADITLMEQQIMLAIHNLGSDAYGVSIRDKIFQRTKKELSFGSVYAVLERLERNGYVTSREGESTAVRGGRKKLYFKVTGTGYAAVQASLAAVDAMRDGFDAEGAMA